MAQNLKISYNAGSFKIELPGGQVLQKTSTELLNRGGLVGINTKRLMRECKASPGKVVAARFP